MNPNQTSKLIRHTPCAAALLLGLVTFLLFSATTQAATPPSLNWNGDTGVYSFTADNDNTNDSTPGLKITLPAYTELNQIGWELTAFTWLSTSTLGDLPTGRGNVMIFDSTFDPIGKSTGTVNSSTTGLIAKSGDWTKDTTLTYPFASTVILNAETSYYFLNSGAIRTGTDPKAPYNYGFYKTEAIANVQRLNISNSNWAIAVGAPNFSMTLTPVISTVPEPTMIAALLGLAGLGVVLFKKRLRRS